MSNLDGNDGKPSAPIET